MGSNKNVLLPYRLVVGSGTTAGNQVGGTLSGNITSGSVAIPYLDNIGIQINVTAPALTAGIFTVNASLDGTAYMPLVLSGTPAVSGSADTILISLNQVPFRFLTVNYTSSTAGTGSCDVWVMSKEIG